MASSTVEVTVFADKTTGTGTFVIVDPETKKAAIVDSVLDFSASSGVTTLKALEPIFRFVAEQGLQVEWILESHPHADHISGAWVLKEKYGAPIGIGSGIKTVAATFQKLLNLEAEVLESERYFDRLFEDGDTFQLGSKAVRVIKVNGHTPACVAYYIDNDAIFVGDTLFLPDQGTARCDFPHGSAETLFDSVAKILALPDHVRVFVGHDYGGVGAKREVAFATTVAAEKADSIHVKAGTSKEEFVRMRTERDATLSVPNLLYPSIQCNLRAGRLPPPESNGASFVKIPLTPPPPAPL